jgi:hypothetical protein
MKHPLHCPPVVVATPGRSRRTRMRYRTATIMEATSPPKSAAGGLGVNE